MPDLQTTLEKWRQMERAATKRPWAWNAYKEMHGPHEGEECTCSGIEYKHQPIIETDGGFYGPADPDRVFIAHARNTYPLLLTRLTEMAAASTKLLNDLEVFRKSHERLQEGTIVLQAWDVSGSKKAVEAALRPLEAVDG